MAVDTLLGGDPVSSATRSTSIALRRFTRDEYDRMIALGLFEEDEHLELIDGRVVEKTTQGSRHATAVQLVERALSAVFAPGFFTRAQMPLALDEYSEPEPDVAVVAGEVRDYRDAHPAKAVLVVEVADRTLAFDRGRKLRLYARAGIPEVWIVNLVETKVEVHTEPAGARYWKRSIFAGGDALSPAARRDARIQVDELLP
jgi:Uma2 family endonuclease